MKQITCFHLLNDYSGSPRVLNSVISGFIKRGYKIDLITSDTEGFLSEFKNNSQVRYHTYKYSFSNKKFFTAINYIYAQIYLMICSLRCRKRDTIIWINTILPIGAAIIGYLMNKKIICHYHEDAQTKGNIYTILSSIIQKTASYIICVSDYQKNKIRRDFNICTIPNSLSIEFETASIEKTYSDKFLYKRILMLASLKKYKGIDSFVKLAHLLPEFSFMLIINDTIDNINEYLSGNNSKIPSNLKIIDRQKNTLRYYQSSSLVVNLSDKNLFVETFGLTALEAMSMGLPCIVPTIGGIAELVEDGVNGYKIDVQQLNLIADTIKMIHSDKDLYIKLSKNAQNKFQEFSHDSMMRKIIKVIDSVDPDFNSGKA